MIAYTTTNQLLFLFLPHRLNLSPPWAPKKQRIQVEVNRPAMTHRSRQDNGRHRQQRGLQEIHLNDQRCQLEIRRMNDGSLYGDQQRKQGHNRQFCLPDIAVNNCQTKSRGSRQERGENSATEGQQFTATQDGGHPRSRRRLYTTDVTSHSDSVPDTFPLI